jgi:acetyl-CoA carboxylase biotin carboxyl carrier protein
VPEAATLEPSGAEVDQPEAETDRFLEVTSPMVGTFYRAPSPDSPPYVDVGAAVGKGSVLCIIEAMKLMNELECEVEGTVARILVENAQPVEYGQVLFLIDPS